MKTRRLFAAIATIVALLPMLAPAAVITQADPEPLDPPGNRGITYFWTVTLGSSDFGTASDHVGAWSWEDDTLFEPGEQPVGWTHTSEWVALTLTEPANFTFRLAAQAGVPWPGAGLPDRVASTANMNPSFTLWANWDNDGVDSDTYNNRGNMPWAEDLSYLDHIDNSTQPFVERTWTLPAGNYSLALGSNAPATDLARQGYLATFTTTPVPEPGTAMLLLTSLFTLGLRRRRAV